MDEIQLHDESTLTIKVVDQANQPVDVSTGIAFEFIFRKPSRTRWVVTPTPNPAIALNALSYTFQTSEVDEINTWQVQAKVQLASGQWHTTKSQFLVKENL